MNDIVGSIMGALMALLSPAATPAGYTGYIEADPVYVAPVSTGRIVEMPVEEGESVAAGSVLFRLDDSQQQASLAAAEARSAAARATLANLTTGSRSEELDVIRATLRKAEADLDMARSTLSRSEKLHLSGTVPAARVDQDRTTLAASEAQVAQLRAQLAVAELPARNAQQEVAQANLLGAEAEAQRARIDLAERRTTAPVGGVVDSVYFTAGEVATGGTPVVAILPEGALEARFFVPEPERGRVQPGTVVTVTCDGCAPAKARVVHLANSPQTTPPVIYSREERSRLVYLVKARLGPGSTLQPGQPVTVLP